MAAQVIWAESATDSYEGILAFLLQLWGLEIALRFEKLVDEIQDRLRLQPKLGAPTEVFPGNRKFVLHENATLYYRYDEGMQVVELLRFFDTRQDPSKLAP